MNATKQSKSIFILVSVLCLEQRGIIFPFFALLFIKFRHFWRKNKFTQILQSCFSSETKCNQPKNVLLLNWKAHAKMFLGTFEGKKFHPKKSLKVSVAPSHLSIEWGWVGYEEFYRSRKVFRSYTVHVPTNLGVHVVRGTKDHFSTVICSHVSLYNHVFINLLPLGIPLTFAKLVI